jgi:hypothetical protein
MIILDGWRFSSPGMVAALFVIGGGLSGLGLSSSDKGLAGR